MIDKQNGPPELAPVPVTVVFAREVKPDRIEDFEQWMKGISRVVREYDGYQSMDIIRPGDHAHPEYVIVLRFEEYHNLRAWMSSADREEWLEKSHDMVVGETFAQEAHGFESWFTLPQHEPAAGPPAKYKMAILTMLAIYPLLLVAIAIFNRLLEGWPQFLIVLVTVIVLVSLMTYLVMPWVTKLFRFWLFPRSRGSR